MSDTAVDLKTEVLNFFSENFGIDLYGYPKIWEEMYDLFKQAKETKRNPGELIKKHLVNGEEINDMDVMELMTKAHALFQKLISEIKGK